MRCFAGGSGPQHRSPRRTGAPFRLSNINPTRCRKGPRSIPPPRPQSLHRHRPLPTPPTTAPVPPTPPASIAIATPHPPRACSASAAGRPRRRPHLSSSSSPPTSFSLLLSLSLSSLPRFFIPPICKTPGSPRRLRCLALPFLCPCRLAYAAFRADRTASNAARVNTYTPGRSCSSQL